MYFIHDNTRALFVMLYKTQPNYTANKQESYPLAQKVRLVGEYIHLFEKP